MKFSRLAGFASAFSALSVSVVYAADGTWTSTAGGNWTDGTNWAGNGIADASGFTANFTSDIATDAMVNLNGTNRTIGNIVFSDNGALGSTWTITGNQLNLAVGAGSPTITTTTNATIESVINGSQGLTKAGAGTLTLTGSNLYAGTTVISGGELELSGGDNRLATTGTINFTGNSTLDLGNTNQTLASLSVGTNGVTGTITGTGKLTLNGSSALSLVASSNSASRALNMSGLSSFEYNNSTGTFGVEAYAGATNGTSRSATVTLAGTSAITASQLTVGGTGTTGAVNSNSATLNLGASATMNADTIAVSGYSINGTIGYLSGTTNAALTIRGKDGTSRVQSMTVGNYSPGNTTGKVDLSTNVSGTSTLDAMIDTLIIGYNNRGSSGSANNSTGTFTMKGGTLDVTTMVIGASSTGSSNGGTTNGTFTSGTGGIVKVDTLKLGNDLGGGAHNITATFNLNGGATAYAKNITAGTTTGTGTKNRTFNWNDGTIRNYDASTDLTISSGLTTFALLGTGTHAFDIDNGRTGIVNQNISGAGTGALTKNGNGTLIFTGTNTYSANTTVNAGTLRVNGVNSGTGAVNVAATGRLEGTGSIAGAVNVTGVIAPGASIESLRTGALAFSNNSTLAFEFDSTTANADLLGVNGTLDLVGTVNLTLSDLGTGILAHGTKFTLINYTSGWTSTELFTYLGNTLADDSTFTLGGNQWVFNYNDTTGGSNFTGDQTVGTNFITMTVVPEPSVALLGGLGALALLRRRRM